MISLVKKLKSETSVPGEEEEGRRETVSALFATDVAIDKLRRNQVDKQLLPLLVEPHRRLSGALRLSKSVRVSMASEHCCHKT